jgi:hypothetical protein
MGQEKMEAITLGGRSVNTSGCDMVEQSSPFNDGRFGDLYKTVTDLKNLNRELNEMFNYKVNALLGETPSVPRDSPNKETTPNGWLEEVMFEARIATKFCKDSLEKFSVV